MIERFISPFAFVLIPALSLLSCPEMTDKAYGGIPDQYQLNTTPMKYVYTTTAADTTQLFDAISQLQTLLLASFNPEAGCWVGRQWMSPSLTAEFILLTKYLERDEPELLRLATTELLNNQQADGGFSAYNGGPSELSTSCICRLALELIGQDTLMDAISRSSAFIDQAGGINNALLIAKFYSFLFDRWPVHKLPQLRPELTIVPRFTRGSIYDMGSWARSWIVPLSILWHFEKYQLPDSAPDGLHPRFPFYIPPLRKAGIRKASRWMLSHQDTDGSWYGAFSSTMIHLMALKRLGYSSKDPLMESGWQFILSLQDRSGGTLRQQPFLGPVWDTGHALNALLSGGIARDKPEIRESIPFLLAKQSREPGDWSINNPAEPGGWPFQYENKYYPDVDDTAIVLRALGLYFGEQSMQEESIRRGLNWLLSMQNRDGSWGAFDRNNNSRIVPWYLKLRHYYIGDGPGLITDGGTPDLTAHALETLAHFGYSLKNKEVGRAIRWLKKQQQPDGSWFGRWGLCYLFGTSSVLVALESVGENMNQPYILKAIDFLEKNQQADGGYGERPEAYFDPAFKGQGPSDPTQTAWVVMGLLAAGKSEHPSVSNAVEYLIHQISKGEKYHPQQFHAVAAPPLYQRYEWYPVYYPLMALQQYHGWLNR